MNGRILKQLREERRITQGARAARAGGVLAVDGSADAQGARAGSAAGGSVKNTDESQLKQSFIGGVIFL